MSPKLAIVLASIAAVTPSLAANSTARVTSFANSTGTRTANNTGPISSSCCFVVQDNVNENWWQIYTTPPPVYSVVNVTSITTLVTPYSNGTVTNYETNVHTTNASFTRGPQQIGFNPASLLIDNAPQPFQTTTALNGSQVTGPISQVSPAAFWIYTKLKVITVPAVTNSNGDAVCATTSTAQSVRVSAQTPITNSFETIPEFTTTFTYDFANSKGGPEIFTISGVNSHAEAYFGGYNIKSAATLTYSGSVTTFAATTDTIRANSPVWQYSNGVTFSYNGPTSTAAAVLTFPTPYIYFPSRGATGATGESANDVCIQTGGNENYGYVPQKVIDYIASVPELSSQYPGIASCLPGGPSIIHSFPCSAAAPTSQKNVGTDLTSNTIVTVPGNVNAVPPPVSVPVTSPPNQPSSPAANSPANNSPSPTAQAGPSPNSPANSPNPQPTSPATNPAPSQNPPANSPNSQAPAESQPNNNPPSNPTANSVPAGQNQPSGNPQPANPPASSSPNNQPGSSQNPAANQQNSQPAGNQPNSNRPSNPTANPASPAGQNQASGNPQATNAPSNAPNGQRGASQKPSSNSQPAGNAPNNSPGSLQASGNSQAPANNPGGIASAIASGMGMSQNPANPTPGSGSGAQGSGSAVGASGAASNAAGGSRSAISTSAIQSVISSGGSAVGTTNVGSSTIFAGAGGSATSATQGSGSAAGGGAQGSSNATPGIPSSARGSGTATGNGPANSAVQASGSMALINKISIGSILGVSSALLVLAACV